MSSARKGTKPSSSGTGSKKKPGSSSTSSSSSATKQATQPGLLESVQHRFATDVFESASAADPGWKILIVDETAMKVISAAVGMYDIMERKVTLVESLEKKRAPFKDMGAIYIIAPTSESIDRLLEDFADKSKVLYGANVFIYSLGAIPGHAIERLKKSKQLMRRLKALSEINVDFLVKEQRAYVLDMHQPFSRYYLRNTGSPIEITIAEKLVTLCATLNEYPYIRYKQTSGVCSSLASLFKMKMDEYVGQNPDWWYHGSGKNSKKSAERDRSSMLLLDRSTDCLTPLMHDFTYQAMVHDLLAIEGDKITYSAESPDTPGATEDKDVLLNEKDKLWVELRGKHIAEVVEILSGRIKEVVNSSTNSALSKDKSAGSNLSLSQLASALKDLPEYREVMSKLSQHMHISHQCMDVFNQNGLLDLSDLEQTLATGKDEDGRSPKQTEMISRVEGALIRMTDAKHRLRMILLATISQNGLSSADRDRLLRAAQLSRDELQTLDSLSKLGIQTLNNSGTPSTGNRFFGGGKGKLQSSGSFDEDSEYASSRYVPTLKAILQELVANQLSIEEYPSVVPMPDMPSVSTSATSARRRGKGAETSARKKKGATDKWSRTGASPTTSTASANYAGGRNLVFVVGGMCYSELRVAREVMEKESREIVVGSTSFISPADFINDLATLTGN